MSENKQTNVSITHELLTPLNIILGLTQILCKDNSLSSQHKEMIETIQNAGENLLSQIHEIFDMPDYDTDTEICLSNKKISGTPFSTPIHVLIVDDVAVNRFVIKKMLSKYSNVSSDESADAQSAIDQIQIKKPHIVFIDLHMPDMNGFEVIQQIRKDESNQDIVFVMMSSEGRTYHEDQIDACGVDAYLSKPIRAGKLYTIFEQFVPKICDNQDETDAPVIAQPDKLPDENFLQELIRLARQGAYSEIKNLMEQLKSRQSEFMAFIHYLEQLLKKFQFKEMIDWINSSRTK